MKKLLLLILIVCLTFLVSLTFVNSEIYLEPWTQNQIGDNHNLTGMEYISANTFSGFFTGNFSGNILGNISGDIDSSRVKNPPMGCPNSSVIKSFNENFSSVTCYDGWLDISGTENLTRDLFITGNLSVWDLIVRSGFSITLAQLTIENKGTHTDFNTDLMIHVEEEPTTYLGVQAHNDSVWTHANFILEAGVHGSESTLNIVKNSPSHPFYPNVGSIINEGSFATFVRHDEQFDWVHYTDLYKDEYGNIINLQGGFRLMMLNDTSLNLEAVDLIVNGTATANYFFGDGSQLTNINKNSSSHWTQDGDDIYYNLGEVGIGTSIPDSELDVKGTITADEIRADSFTIDGNHFSQHDDGIYIGGVKIEENLWEVYNPGQIWTQKRGSGYWQEVAISSIGKYQTAVSYDNNITISSDYGETWTYTSSGIKQWYGIAISSDGKYQTAMAMYDDIYISSNYGVTWTGAGAGGGSWSNVDISSDGRMQVAAKGGVGADGPIYISYDYGNTWTQKGVSGYWQGVAMSSDGKYITAVGGGAKIYRSVDYGETWSNVSVSLQWKDIAMSVDGRYQTAVNEDENKKVFVSSDYGLTFQQKGLVRGAYSVAMSSDGRIQIYSASNYDPSDYSIYLSEDYGQTWTQLPGTRQPDWYGLAMSSDGMYMVGASDNNGVFVSQADYKFAGEILIDGDLNVTGDIELTGNLYTDTTFYLFDGAFGRMGYTATQSLIISPNASKGLIVDDIDVRSVGNFRPSANNTYDLGTTTNPWKDLFISGKVNASSATINGDLNVTGTSYLGDIMLDADNITVNNLIPKSGGDIDIIGNLDVDENFTVGGESIFNNLVKYNTDYSSSYTDRTLVDKEYADYGSILAQNVQSTGLTSGAVITKASATTLNISAGTGYIIEYVDPFNPLVIRINYSGIPEYTPINLNSNGTFIMGLNSTGDLVELESGLSSQEKHDYILLGIYVARGGIILTTVDAPFNLGYNGIATAKDFINRVIGPANIEGNIISPNGENLKLDNNGGTIFMVAANFRNNPEVPDEVTISAGVNISFMQVYRQASPSNQLDNTGAPKTNIDPDRWDDGSGTLADVSAQDFTVQVLYIAPDGSYWVAYGQEVFNTLSNAESALLDGTLTLEEFPFELGVVRRAFIIVKEGTTDLSDLSDAKFFFDGKFRAGGITIGGVRIHSSLSQLEWDVAGHTFENGGVMDIGYYNFTTTGSIIVNNNITADYYFGIGSQLTNLTESQIIDLQNYLVEGTSINVTGIFNSGGDLKIMPDVQGDVILFGDTDVGDGEISKYLYVRRQAVEGDDYVRLYINHDTTGVVSASSSLTVYGGDSVTLQAGTKDIIFRVGDDAGAKGVYFKNTNNDIVGSVDSLGNAQFNVSIDVPEISNSVGDLKLQPDVAGNVILFGDTDVANDENGKELRIWRRAPEGNAYMRFYFSANENGFIHSSDKLTMQGQADFTINSVTDDIIFKVGDNASTKKFYFKDSDGNNIAEIDSNGNIDVQGNYIHQGNVGFSGTCINATYSGGLVIGCND